MQYVHLNKIGKELILDLINRDNQAYLPTPLTFADIDISEPEAIPSVEGSRNTRVLVTPAVGSKYSSERLVSYWRLDLEILFKEEFRTLGITDTIEDTNDLIAVLNQRFGLVLTEDDVEIEPIDTETMPVDYTLKTKEGSYAFIGEVTFTLTLDLNDIIVTNLLDGFNYPQDPIVEHRSPELVDGDGLIFAGSGIHGHIMQTADNGEVEVFAGAHRRGPPNAYVTPVDGLYDIPLADGRLWNWSFGIGLLNTDRGDVLTELYDITMRVAYSGGGEIPFTLERLNDNLVWSVEGLGPVIVDNAPVESLTIAQNSQQTRWYQQAYPTVVSNGAGANLGEFTITIEATPKRAIWMPPVSVTITVNVTPE